jgi:hypothetical protein
VLHSGVGIDLALRIEFEFIFRLQLILSLAFVFILLFTFSEEAAYHVSDGAEPAFTFQAGFILHLIFELAFEFAFHFVFELRQCFQFTLVHDESSCKSVELYGPILNPGCGQRTALRRRRC